MIESRHSPSALDPELQAVIREVDSWGPLPPLSAETVSTHRVASFRELVFANAYEEVGEVRELVATGGPAPVRVKAYLPPNDSAEGRPALIRLHGGGMVMGAPEMEDRSSRSLVRRTGCVVLAPAYRLAPEHPFPAAVDDCVAAIEWALDEADELGVDREKVAVLGHSAGALLALSCASALRGRSRIARFVALEPTIGPASSTESRHRFGEGYLLTNDDIDACWSLYLSAGGHGPRLAIPADASASDFAGADAITIITSELDPLRDEGEQFAQRLAEAGIDVEHHRLRGSIHGSLGFMGVSRIARDAFQTVVRTLERSWGS